MGRRASPAVKHETRAEWKEGIQEALSFKAAHPVEADKIDAIIKEILLAAIDYFRTTLQPPRPAASVEKRRKYRTPQRLREIALYIGVECLTIKEGELTLSSQLVSAIVAHKVQTKDPLQLLTTFDIQAGLRRSFIDVIKAVNILAADLERQSSNLIPEIKYSRNGERKHLVWRLMQIFAEYRKENVKDIKIGNPDLYKNPLMEFLSTVCTPIAEIGGEFPVYIPAATLRADATAVRKTVRSAC